MSNDPAYDGEPESAVVVLVPEAEAAVGPLRARLDPAAALGVPAHVTVLYPFVPPGTIGPDLLAVLGRAVASVQRFTVVLRTVRWFDETAVWLAPEPAEPFRDLTAAVWRHFPETPPYGGAHTDPVPHLTVGSQAPVDDLLAAADAVRSSLPIRAHVDRVHLLSGTAKPSSWSRVAAVPLGGAGG